MENSFLKEFKDREYFNQCTNSEELEQLMRKEKIKAYIGFDCTASSACWKSTTNNVSETFAKTRSPANSVVRRRHNKNWRSFGKRRN